MNLTTPRFRTPAIPKRTFGLRVLCKTCGLPLDEPKVETTNLFQQEKEDLLLKIAVGKGWKVIKEGEHALASKWVQCPRCQEKLSKALTIELPPFAVVTPCPKCGNEDTAMKFCNGLMAGCVLGVVRDHMHRSCPRCGYDMLQACQDERKTT